MELSKQVCSLELAQKLKELGVKQESLFYYEKYPDIEYSNVPRYCESGQWDKDSISAFTVAELGEMLPNDYQVSDDSYAWFKTSKDMWDKWTVAYEQFTPTEKQHFQTADTEADARAKMLCYLIENKLITI